MKKCFLLSFLVLVCVLISPVQAQDTATLYKALIHLEQSLSNLDDSLNQAIDEKVGSQESLLQKQQGQLREQRVQLVAVQKEVRALQQAFEEPAPRSNTPSATLPETLEKRMEALDQSVSDLDAAQQKLERLLFQLQKQYQPPARSDSSMNEPPAYQEALESLARQINTVAEALNQHRREQKAEQERTAGVTTRFEKFAIDGFVRFRGNRYYNFDLNQQGEEDNVRDYMSVRSFVNMGVKQGDFNALLSLNLAGSEFDDGFFWGSEEGAPLQPWNTSIQYLVLDYNGIVDARLGRMPAIIGNSIVGHSTQDGLRIRKDINDFSMTGYWFKGDEVLRSNPDELSLFVYSDSTGGARDLDVLMVPVEWRVNPVSKIEFVFARQFDSRPDQGFPEKMYFDLNLTTTIDRITYDAEFAVLRGETPFDPFSLQRNSFQAYMLYLSTYYQQDNAGIGWSVGYGSGDRDPLDGIDNNFQSLFLDETGYHFTHIFSDDLHGYTGSSGDLARASGFGNVTFFQVHGSMQPRQALTLRAYATLLRASQARDRGTGIFGTNTSEDLTRKIGYEVDLMSEYQLTDFSSLFLSAGLFVPGEVFAYQDLAYKITTGVAIWF